MSATKTAQNGKPTVPTTAAAAEKSQEVKTTTTKDRQKELAKKKQELAEQREKFHHLNKLSRHHETINQHLERIGKALKSPDLQSELEETEEEAENPRVTAIYLKTSNSRYDGYEIKSPALLEKVIRFLKSELEVKLEEVENEMLSVF